MFEMTFSTLNHSWLIPEKRISKKIFHFETFIRKWKNVYKISNFSHLGMKRERFKIRPVFLHTNPEFNEFIIYKC